MNDFILKKFEIGGLNCFLSDISIRGLKKNFLSEVLQAMSQSDQRFAFKTTDFLYSNPVNSITRWRSGSSQRGNTRVFLRLGESKMFPGACSNRFIDAWQTPIRKLTKISWNDPSDLYSALCESDSVTQLEATENEDLQQEFRYSIMDADGRLIMSNFDSIRPIFSDGGPIVQSGCSVRIDLVSVAGGLTRHLPILARSAHRNS